MSEKKTIAGLLQEDTNWFQDKIVANSPVIIAIFANAVVIFADYRVYDVMYQLTQSWWKSLGASLGCAPHPHFHVPPGAGGQGQ